VGGGELPLTVVYLQHRRAAPASTQWYRLQMPTTAGAEPEPVTAYTEGDGADLLEGRGAGDGQFRLQANLVARLAYAGGSLPTDAVQLLEAFWDRITAPQPELVAD